MAHITDKEIEPYTGSTETTITCSIPTDEYNDINEFIKKMNERYKDSLYWITLDDRYFIIKRVVNKDYQRTV